MSDAPITQYDLILTKDAIEELTRKQQRTRERIDSLADGLKTVQGNLARISVFSSPDDVDKLLTRERSLKHLLDIAGRDLEAGARELAESEGHYLRMVARFEGRPLTSKPQAAAGLGPADASAHTQRGI